MLERSNARPPKTPKKLENSMNLAAQACDQAEKSLESFVEALDRLELARAELMEILSFADLPLPVSVKLPEFRERLVQAYDGFCRKARNCGAAQFEFLPEEVSTDTKWRTRRRGEEKGRPELKSRLEAESLSAEMGGPFGDGYPGPPPRPAAPGPGQSQTLDNYLDRLDLARRRAFLCLAIVQAARGQLAAAKKLTRDHGLSLGRLPDALKIYFYYYAATFIKGIKPKGSDVFYQEAQKLYTDVFHPANRPAGASGREERLLAQKIRLGLANKLLERGDIHRARLLAGTDWSPDPDERVSALKAETLFAMIRLCLKLGIMGEARELNETLAAYQGQSPEILCLRVKAGTLIVEALLRRDMLSEALNFLKRPTQGPHRLENQLIRAWLTLPVVGHYLEGGLLPDALSLYQDLAASLRRDDLPSPPTRPDPETERLIVALGWVALAILEEFARQRRLAEAKGFYAELQSLGPTQAAQDARALAANLLIAGSAQVGQLKEAREIFLTLPEEANSKAVAEAKRTALQILPNMPEEVGFETQKRFEVEPDSRQSRLWRFKVNRWWDWARFMVKTRN
ncbi:MAG: hypothetical protein LBE01_01025 [Deltaproteobacteria bacterium]|nr:hypothetical protein [Deltaproteobacteria bacterium]